MREPEVASNARKQVNGVFLRLQSLSFDPVPRGQVPLPPAQQMVLFLEGEPGFPDTCEKMVGSLLTGRSGSLSMKRTLVPSAGWHPGNGAGSARKTSLFHAQAHFYPIDKQVPR